ncbi:hypothetical protein Tco_1277028 [Tanacetum coccineum]
MYPLTKSESSAGDSFSESSVRPSRKRCRSPAATVTLSIHATRALVPFHTDLLPPRKWFRDSISPKDSVEEDIDTDVLEDIKADATAIEVAIDRDVVTEVDAGIDMEIDVGVDVEDEVEDEFESSDRGTMKVGVDVAIGIDIPDGDIETGQRELEARSLIAGGERASLLKQVASLERSNVRLRGTMMMERARTDRRLETFAVRRLEALAANALKAESQSQNGSDDDNGNGGNGNGGDGNGGDGNGGNGNPNENNRGARPFEKMETVFHISNSPKKYQVKYATYTLLNSTLTWWNSHKRTIGAKATFSMSWRELMKLMAEVYCPRTKIQKMESEL